MYLHIHLGLICQTTLFSKKTEKKRRFRLKCPTPKRKSSNSLLPGTIRGGQMTGVCVGRGCWNKLVIGHFSSSNQEQLHMYLFFNLLIYIWSKISISSKIWLVRFWKLNMRQNSNSNFNFIFDPSCTVLPSYNPWGACLQAMIVPNRSFQFLVPNQSFSSICESWSWACVLKGAL